MATLCERLEDDGFERRDYSLEAWEAQGPPSDVFSYWKASVPDPEARRGILVDDAVLRHNDRIRFVALQVVCGSKGPQTAELELEVDGQRHTAKANGNGPVDATFEAITAIVPHEAVLKLYQVHAVTGGTDAE